MVIPLTGGGGNFGPFGWGRGMRGQFAQPQRVTDRLEVRLVHAAAEGTPTAMEQALAKALGQSQQPIVPPLDVALGHAV